MASASLLSLILLGKFSSILSAPALENTTNSSTYVNTKSSETNPPLLITHPNVHVDVVDSFMFGPPSIAMSTSSPPASINSPSDVGRLGFSFSFMTTTTSFPVPIPETPPATVTVTKEEPTTVTVAGPQITITETITATTTVTPTSPAGPPSSGLGPAKEVWVAPKNMTNLDSFGITKFAGGQHNLKVVSSIAAEASVASFFGESADKDGTAAERKDDKRAAMQLLYPENSINPAQEPMGGAEFYASPIDISGARNVTLGYSVFFPINFDWVLAGKLPGLYGGHTGCSGGNAALDCFSTRLMWRAHGAGELYLYAPKDKQTDALCTARGSVCDAAYGLSIGRGSFTWAAGAWTTIHQTVYLNTPGEKDGVFTLEVNGKTVIHRKDVFYREDLSGSGGGKDGKTNKPTPTPTKTTRHSKPTSATSDDGGLLGPILGGLVDGLLDGGRREEVQDLENRELRPRQQETSLNKDASATSGDPRSTIEPSPQPTVDESQPTETGLSVSSDTFGIQSAKPKEVKFAGIFFSTFFGGHEDKYATPRDQYVWFRDFALAHNF